MPQTLRDLVDSGLMTEAEATELQAYLTSDPATYWQAPQPLRDKKRQDKSQQQALHQSLRSTLILSSPQKAALFQPRPKTSG